MRILEEIYDEEACSKENACPEPSGVTFSYIGLMLYMIIVNVLLLNLLIAMFRYMMSLTVNGREEIVLSK